VLLVLGLQQLQAGDASLAMAGEERDPADHLDEPRPVELGLVGRGYGGSKPAWTMTRAACIPSMSDLDQVGSGEGENGRSEKGALKSTGQLPLPLHGLTAASRSLLDLSGRLFSVNRRKNAIWKESCARRLRGGSGDRCRAMKTQFCCRGAAATRPIWYRALAYCALCAAR